MFYSIKLISVPCRYSLPYRTKEEEDGESKTNFRSNRYGPFLLIRLPKYLGPVAMESGCEKRNGCGEAVKRSEWLETAWSLRCGSDEDGFIRSPVARRGCHPSSVEYSAELWSGTVWDRVRENEKDRARVVRVREEERRGREGEWKIPKVNVPHGTKT